MIDKVRWAVASLQLRWQEAGAVKRRWIVFVTGVLLGAALVLFLST